MFLNNGTKEMGDYLNNKQKGIHVFLNADGTIAKKKYG